MIELAEWINARTVERAYAAAQIASTSQDWDFYHVGCRAAQKQDPKLLKALEGMAEILDRMVEDQMRHTLRSQSTPSSYRVPPTEASLVREAYRICAEGPSKYPEPEKWAKTLEHFGWIYGGATMLAGLYHPSRYSSVRFTDIAGAYRREGGRPA